MAREIYSSSFWMDAFVDHLLFSLKHIKLDSVNGSIKSEKNCLNRSCMISIPYASEFLVWQMNFNAQYPELGPDLILRDEDFWQDENVEKYVSNMSNLFQWNCLKNVSLCEVISQLLSTFKEYQVNLLQTNSDKLFLEYRLLKENQNVSNLEVYHIHEPKAKNVLISLEYTWKVKSMQCFKNTGHVVIVLLFNYCCPAIKMVASKLRLPKHLENLFDKREISVAPSLNDNQHVIDYIDEIGNYIFNKVNTFLHGMDTRKQLIANIATIQYCSLLEYDVIFFQWIRLLINYSNINFVLKIQLTPYFPDERFSITLQSIYHMKNGGKPAQFLLPDFSYNSCWEIKRMTLEVFNHVFNFIIAKFYNVEVLKFIKK